MITGTHKSVAIIGNQGFSLLNFRGPLIANLVARGHTVTALAPEMTAEIAESLQQLGATPIEIQLSRTGTNPLQDLNSIFSLRRALITLRPDVTLGYAVKPVVYGTIAAWLAGVPRRFAMVEGLGYAFTERPDDRWPKRVLRSIVKGLYRFALRRTDRVFFLNDEDIADFGAMRLVPRAKALRIGGIGVDLTEWLPAPVVTSPMTFTLVARLLRDKGIVEYIEAARITKQFYPATRFVLVGGLDANPESISMAEVVGWVNEGLVEWPGHVPVGPWLAQTSVFVLPSYREGVPRSTQEAMAMGRAVITTDAVGCRDTVVDGRNGYLVPPRNVPALVRAMQRFIVDPHLISGMGHQSRCLAEERFDVRKVNATIMEAMGL